jgi:hypothetical protein
LSEALKADEKGALQRLDAQLAEQGNQAAAERRQLADGQSKLEGGVGRKLEAVQGELLGQAEQVGKELHARSEAISSLQQQLHATEENGAAARTRTRTLTPTPTPTPSRNLTPTPTPNPQPQPQPPTLTLTLTRCRSPGHSARRDRAACGGAAAGGGEPGARARGAARGRGAGAQQGLQQGLQQG